MDKREIVNQYVMYAKGYLAFLDEKEREVRSSMAQLRRRPPEQPEPADLIEAHSPEPVSLNPPPEPPPTVRVEQFVPPVPIRDPEEKDDYQGINLPLKKGKSIARK